jgi:hypothetical protein
MFAVFFAFLVLQCWCVRRHRKRTTAAAAAAQTSSSKITVPLPMMETARAVGLVVTVLLSLYDYFTDIVTTTILYSVMNSKCFFLYR